MRSSLGVARLSQGTNTALLGLRVGHALIMQLRTLSSCGLMYVPPQLTHLVDAAACVDLLPLVLLLAMLYSLG
eukprot:7338913-Alexandrium_andersonii.AAC.1